MTETLLTLPELDERYRRLRLVQPSAERAVRASMERLGQLQPAVACQRGDATALLDGFKRLSAARALGLPTLRVRIIEVSEASAIAAVMSLNRAGRGLSDLEQALCVRALVREHGLTQVAVAELLGRHKSWVSRRLALAERLCESVADDVRAGLITTTVAREVSRLPRGNQPDVATTVARAALTSREASDFVALFEKTSEGPQRVYLLAEPREALAAHGTKLAQWTHDPRLGPRTQAVRQRLYATLRAMSDLGARLEDTAPARWTETERRVLAPVVDKVHGVAVLLTDKLAAARATLEAPDG